MIKLVKNAKLENVLELVPAKSGDFAERININKKMIN